eukprot:CAMPEP_0172304738 /NCGR_PEP_ID=MMETSP1058-20130122/6123_1 /TAXON_ID=83371 /ORGANISM="Detonula confervacea, Strain CCMP 353" /LENGTH=39 /DNA_ID= /DNA_START= /DNA_END= /DNA_ORIENTATION=
MPKPETANTQLRAMPANGEVEEEHKNESLLKKSRIDQSQ